MNRPYAAAMRAYIRLLGLLAIVVVVVVVVMKLTNRCYELKKV